MSTSGCLTKACLRPAVSARLETWSQRGRRSWRLDGHKLDRQPRLARCFQAAVYSHFRSLPVKSAGDSALRPTAAIRVAGGDLCGLCSKRPSCTDKTRLEKTTTKRQHCAITQKRLFCDTIWKFWTEKFFSVYPEKMAPSYAPTPFLRPSVSPASALIAGPRLPDWWRGIMVYAVAAPRARRYGPCGCGLQIGRPRPCRTPPAEAWLGVRCLRTALAGSWRRVAVCSW